MLGLMQDWPLLCHRIIEHAARVHGQQEVVTRSVEGPIHRTNYRDIQERALKVSQALALQLLLWEMSESMGNHDSEVVDASSVD